MEGATDGQMDGTMKRCEPGQIDRPADRRTYLLIEMHGSKNA